MKTLTSLCFTGCLLVVIALQVTILRNQRDRDYQPTDEPALVESADAALIELGGTDVAQAATTEDGSEADNGSYVALVSAERVSTIEETLPEQSSPDLRLIELEPDSGIEPAPFALNQTPLEAELAVAEGDPGSANSFSPGSSPLAQSLTAPTSDPASEQAQEPAATEKYPMWLLLKPDGVQFLQSDEELAANLSSIPPSAFLVGCFAPAFEGLLVNEKPDFQLSCKKFMLKGCYGTRQTVEIEGAELRYSTQTRKLELKGKDDIELICRINNEHLETHLQADEISFQLYDDSFDVSVKGSTTMEINANPAPVTKPRPSDSRGFDPFPNTGPVNRLPTY